MSPRVRYERTPIVETNSGTRYRQTPHTSDISRVLSEISPNVASRITVHRPGIFKQGQYKQKSDNSSNADKFTEALAQHKLNLVDQVNNELTSAEREAKKQITEFSQFFDKRCKLLQQVEQSKKTTLAQEKLLIEKEDGETSEVTLGQQITYFHPVLTQKQKELQKLWTELAEVRQDLAYLAIEILGPAAIEEASAENSKLVQHPEADDAHDRVRKSYDDVEQELNNMNRDIKALTADTEKENREILESIEIGRKDNMARVRRAIKALEAES